MLLAMHHRVMNYLASLEGTQEARVALFSWGLPQRELRRRF